MSVHAAMGMDVSAIVLAGGRSSRFGRDKLAEPIAGVPLLHLAMTAVAGVCQEIVVVRRPLEAAGQLPGEAPRPVDVPLPVGLEVACVVATDPEPFGGPLVGLLAGAHRATHPDLLVVGGDMPDLVPAVLRLLLEGLAAGLAAATVLAPDRPLPMAVRRAAVLIHAPGLLAAGERSLRALIEHVDSTVIPEPAWRAVDPEARSLHDIDRTTDLPG